MARSNDREKERNRKRAREKRRATEPVQKKKKKVKKILAKYKQGKAELLQHLDEMSKHGNMLDDEIMGMVEDEEVQRVLHGYYKDKDKSVDKGKKQNGKAGDNNQPSSQKHREQVVDNNNQNCHFHLKK